MVGGHTITSTEPLYGMVALGFADAERLVRNSTAAPGERLFLTKPIGTGLIATAIKRGSATAEQTEAAVRTMTTLNAAAAGAMVEAGAAAATDVTGFGLLGHLRKMLEASGVAARVDATLVPMLPGALDLAQRGVVSGGTGRNHAWLNATTDWGTLTQPEQLVLADAQTSGGSVDRHPSRRCAPGGARRAAGPARGDRGDRGRRAGPHLGEPAVCPPESAHRRGSRNIPAP